MERLKQSQEGNWGQDEIQEPGQEHEPTELVPLIPRLESS